MSLVIILVIISLLIAIMVGDIISLHNKITDLQKRVEDLEIDRIIAEAEPLKPDTIKRNEIGTWVK